MLRYVCFGQAIAFAAFFLVNFLLNERYSLSIPAKKSLKGCIRKKDSDMSFVYKVT